MKRVECGRGISELISEKWEHKKIGLYYCFEKNNKIYIPFGNCIEERCQCAGCFESALQIYPYAGQFLCKYACNR